MSTAESITLTNLELTRFFFALVLLLISAHTFGYLFHRYKLPRVIGEIMGGFLLGPTVLGHFFPEIHNWFFNAFPDQGKLLSIVYWLGLVLLMFISGSEIQKTFDRGDKKTIAAILVGATIIPFLAGWIAPFVYDFTPFVGEKNNMLALRIIIAVAVAVTSIPVISRIFIDLKIIDTRFAKIVLTTATVQDVILWAALAIATGLVSTAIVSFANIVPTVLITIAFFGLALLILPRVVNHVNGSRFNFLMKSSITGYLLFICFLLSATASLLEVNIIFGAFLAGIVIGLMPDKKFEKEQKNIKEIALAFFIPIYFAVVGLKLDLVHHFDLTFFVGFLLFTTLFETAGTLIASKFIKKDNLTSFNFAVAMNTRGGPGIVLATIAFDIGIISQSFFVTLVLIAVITSLLAGFWFRYVLNRDWPLMEDEPAEVVAESTS